MGDNLTASRSTSIWRRSMNEILAGLALGLIHFQFGGLPDLLLPLLSFIFGFLGWHRLRRVNSGFRLGWILMLVRTGFFFLEVFLNFTLWNLNALLSQSYVIYVAVWFIVLQAAQLLAFRNGVALFQKKAGHKEDTLVITALVLWDIVLAFLAALNVNGLTVILMLAFGIIILVQIYKLAHSLDEAGSSIAPAPLKLPLPVTIGLALSALLTGSVLCFVCFSRYPMKWRKFEPVYTPSSAAEIGVPKVPSQTEIIINKLLDLGFPEEVLADLSEKDLLYCQNVQKVCTRDCEQYVNDSYRLHVKSVAVVLSENPRVWRIFYHFSLPDQKNYWGTDALEIRPAALYSYSPKISGKPEGTLLMDRGDQTAAAPITRIRKEFCEQESGTASPGSDWSGDAWFAAFSLPRRFRNARGYVTLEVQDIYDGVDFAWGDNAKYLIQSRWSNGLLYVHQTQPLQYPVLSASRFAAQNPGYSPYAPFLHIGRESWFFPEQD